MKSFRIIRQHSGCRFRYYPNCSASKWFCEQFLKRRSFTQAQIEGLRRYLCIEIDIEIQNKKEGL